MSDIHITRHHALGLAEARQLAFKCAEAAEKELDMACVYEEGKTSDVVTFKRTGAHGELKVSKDKFVLDRMYAQADVVDKPGRTGVLVVHVRHQVATCSMRSIPSSPCSTVMRALAAVSLPLCPAQSPARPASSARRCTMRAT